MKIKIVGNKYLNALFILMLGSAIAHMALIFCFAIIDCNWHSLNYFHILDFDRLFSGGVGTFTGDILSWMAMIAIYIAILKLNDERS
ncbi:MAG: hypothetical protein WCX23_00290 [Candidatus Paceibacterota bacterium]|nr:hypothetical protein [Candidatus Paceibacterota bacterium]MDD4830671.1 hypothetical protein [Candidatus Paceibacterota bacterium]MDD4875249.1 hypothetical protein [Candidatus Paceibacterota bacterium]